MAQKSIETIKADIASGIYENSNGLITATVLSEILNDICDSVSPNKVVYEDIISNSVSTVLYSGTNFEVSYDSVEKQIQVTTLAPSLNMMHGSCIRGSVNSSFCKEITGQTTAYLSPSLAADSNYALDTAGGRSINLQFTVSWAGVTELVTGFIQKSNTLLYIQIKRLV